MEQAFPGIYILSEESRSSEHESSPQDVFFLVDPLDGTKEFLKRNDEFTVNIAIISEGLEIAGVVYAPALSELYYAGSDLGAWRCDKNGVALLKVATWDRSLPLRVIGSRSHAGAEMDIWLKTLPVEYTFVPAGSSLKFCRIAEGLADIYPRLAPTSQWDTAAAQCILEEAGGSVMQLNGNVLLYGRDLALLNPYFIASGNCLDLHL